MSELRESGIDVLGEIPWGSHFCTFYETKEDLIDTVVPFFKAGLESTEYCLWVISDSGLISMEETKEAMKEALPDFDRHISDGNMEILDGHDWYLQNNAFNSEKAMSELKAKLKKALASGYKGMRASGDMFWLVEKYWEDFTAYEKQLNNSITDLSVTVLCTYPLAKSSAAEILDAVRTHQFAIARREGKWEIIETPELILAKAEIKKLNEELEQRVTERTRQLEQANNELRNEITERKKAEDELRKSKDSNRLIIDTIPIMAWTMRPDGTVDFLNQRWLDYSGLSLEQYIKEPMAPVHSEDIPGVMEKWLMNKAAGNAYEDEMRLRGADGKYRWFLVRNAPLHDKQGNLIKWYGVSIDIEDSKQAEDELRKSQDSIRLIIDTIPVMTWTLGADGQVDFLNQRWLDYAGISMEE
ncbi:MAG: sensory transduction histidine kinase, partial [Chitinophagaceae bacterium]|nr:sensory transduction histidine kinase [Chitinophagaceae bacterium]